VPSNQILRFERDDGFLAYLWIVRGLKLSTIHTYLHSSDPKSKRLLTRYRWEFEHFPAEPDEPDRDFNLLLIALGFDIVGGLIKLSALARKYKDCLSPSALRREFKLWCEQNGLDPTDFYRRGYGRTGYWVPWEFVEYFERYVLSHYRRSYLTPPWAEEVEA